MNKEPNKDKLKIKYKIRTVCGLIQQKNTNSEAAVILLGLILQRFNVQKF